MTSSTRCLGRLASLAVVGALTATVACKGDSPQETATSDKPATTATASATTATTTTAPMATTTATTSATAATTATAAPMSAAGQDTSPGTTGGDPKNGKFSLADATKGITGSGDLVASIDTSKGKMTCKLYDDKAPSTVANFVGLARGTRPWKDPKTNTWVTRPAYNGTIFHRVIKGFMIQGGDPLGNGTGEPGYVVPDEIWSGAKHDRPGLLCMANRGPNTNGAQFFITDDAAAFLDGKYTIFGECKPLDVEHAIATVDVAGPQHSAPTSPVTINSVTVARTKY